MPSQGGGLLKLAFYLSIPQELKLNAITRSIISAKHFSLHIADTKCQENVEYLAELLYLSLIGSNLRFCSIPVVFFL